MTDKTNRTSELTGNWTMITEDGRLLSHKEAAEKGYPTSPNPPAYETLNPLTYLAHQQYVYQLVQTKCVAADALVAWLELSTATQQRWFNSAIQCYSNWCEVQATLSKSPTNSTPYQTQIAIHLYEQSVQDSESGNSPNWNLLPTSVKRKWLDRADGVLKIINQ